MLPLLALVLLPPSLVAVPGMSLREQSAGLLYEEAVQKRLGMTPEQRRAFERAAKADDDRRAKRAASLDDDRRFAAEATASLTPVQRRALFARAIGLRGVGAMADPEVAALVGLRGAALTNLQARVKRMDDRDGALSDALANEAMSLPEPKTAEENRAYDARRVAMDEAAAPRLKARAAARRAEEKALLAALSGPVRRAWAKLTSQAPTG